MSALPNVYPNPDPRAQINGTVYWTCPKCGKCHRTRVRPGRWHIKCKACDHVFVIGFIMARLPPGPFRAPIDTTITEEMKRTAERTSSFAGPGDEMMAKVEMVEIRSGGRANRVRDIPEPLSINSSDYPIDTHSSDDTDK